MQQIEGWWWLDQLRHARTHHDEALAVELERDECCGLHGLRRFVKQNRVKASVQLAEDGHACTAQRGAHDVGLVQYLQGSDVRSDQEQIKITLGSDKLSTPLAASRRRSPPLI